MGYYIVVVLATALRFVIAVDDVNLNGLWNIKNSSSGKVWYLDLATALIFMYADDIVNLNGKHLILLNSFHSGKFCMPFCILWRFQNKNFVQKYHRSAEQFGSRPGSKLFAKVISGIHL